MKTLGEKALLSGLLLLPLAAVSAYGQGMPGITEVSGTYTNEAVGVEVTFPDGWSGFEVAQTAETTLVATSPGGLSESNPQTMTTVSLLITDKAARDVNDPSSFTQEVSDCSEPSIASRTIAGVQGTEITVECPGTDQKFRMAAVETSENIVVVMFMSPASEFDSNISAFDSTVASLKIQGAMGSIGGPPSEEEPSSVMQSVTVGTEVIQVAVQSSSTISGFALNEESKTVSFTTDGTGSSTTIGVGAILEGPYTVMVDGEPTDDYEESTDSQGTRTITTMHGEGAHEISISGTQVVPEFPIAALGGIAAVVGSIAILGRTRFLSR